MANGGWPVTFSIGLATFNSATITLEEMIHLADGLMYSVKAGGKKGIEARSFD
jgi:GGDEF domain-containing protein